MRHLNLSQHVVFIDSQKQEERGFYLPGHEDEKPVLAVPAKDLAPRVLSIQGGGLTSISEVDFSQVAPKISYSDSVVETNPPDQTVMYLSHHEFSLGRKRQDQQPVGEGQLIAVPKPEYSDSLLLFATIRPAEGFDPIKHPVVLTEKSKSAKFLINRIHRDVNGLDVVEIAVIIQNEGELAVRPGGPYARYSVFQWTNTYNLTRRVQDWDMCLIDGENSFELI